MKTIALFSVRGGIGTTTLSLNLAHMMERFGLRTLVVDCDRRGHMSRLCLDLEAIHLAEGLSKSCVYIDGNLWLVPNGPVARPSEAMGTRPVERLDPIEAGSLRTVSGRAWAQAAARVGADVVILDLGPGTGEAVREAVFACDAVCLVVGPDVSSFRDFGVTGRILREWQGWSPGRMIGYIVHWPPPSPERIWLQVPQWTEEIPAAFRAHALGISSEERVRVPDDPSCLGVLKMHSILAPLARDAHRPTFDLRRAQGIGSRQIQAVLNCRSEFAALTERLAALLGLPTIATRCSA